MKRGIVHDNIGTFMSRNKLKFKTKGFFDISIEAHSTSRAINLYEFNSIL